MARDLSDTLRDALGNVARDALKNVSDVSPSKGKSGPLSGAKGVAAGVGLAAAAPLAKKGVDALRGANGKPLGPAKLASRLATRATDQVGDKVKDVVSSKVDDAGGAGGIAKEAASGLLPWSGGGDKGGGGKGGIPGVGKGRRMPVQQAVDVAVPLETAYNQWTQFEDWPQFMHRVRRVTKEDDCTVSFATKIWGKTKEFTAQIETQRPDERIKWRVSQGITHTGVVTFHELAPRLTRIEVNLDVDPGSLIEKAARGMRHVKRAVRADLHRFKAFIEMNEHETGAWRGVIEDGELVEPHDESYDEGREYTDIEDIVQSEDEDEEEEQDEEEEEQEQEQVARSESEEEGGDESEDEGGNGSGRERTQRFRRQAERTRQAERPRSARRSSSESDDGGSSGGGGSRPSSESSGRREGPAKRASRRPRTSGRS